MNIIKTRHIPRTSLDDGLDIDVVQLMNNVLNLSEGQAKTTLGFFPDLEYAIPVAKYFFSNGLNNSHSSYEDYLERVYDAMNPKESIFDEEVSCRSCGLYDRIVDPKFSTDYRNKPRHSTHFHEHFASQDAISETDPILTMAYNIRRDLTGL